MKHFCFGAVLFTSFSVVLPAIDTMKTVLQVDSYEGFRSLLRRVRAGKFGVLYAGALANALAAILGHYPWVCMRTLCDCVTG